jgi:uncharacterized protein YndB with AHSA1/START domain
MTRISTATDIAQPVERVYDFVSTPGTWPRWHPSSLGVTGATDHSLAVGEEVTEEFFVAGRRGTVVWRVTARDAPRSWTIAGTITTGRGGGGVITYRLEPNNAGTHFTRVFDYRMPNALAKVLDVLILRRRVRGESREALRRLKAALETNGAIIVGEEHRTR